jgi:type II secretory pathway component PulF
MFIAVSVMDVVVIPPVDPMSQSVTVPVPHVVPLLPEIAEFVKAIAMYL